MRNLHEIRKKLRKRQKSEEPWPARVGDASGTIEVPGSPGLWYVRPEGSDLPVIVQRGSAPKIRDYPVWVGSDTHKKRVKRILGVNATAISAGTGAGGNSPTPVEPHASSHFETGWDVVYVTTAQVVDALAYISGGMNVTINPGWAIIAGKPARIAGMTIDMSSHVPASGARWALIRVDEAGAISVQDGNPVGSYADLTPEDMPRLASGYAALAAVRLYAGQTALINITEERDLIDLRVAPDSGNGGSGYAIGLYDSSSLKNIYEASYAGLVAALGEALAGDTVMLPPGDYSGNLTIPDGVALAGQTRDTTRLLGTVTTAGDAILQNLRIEKVTPDTQNEKALVVSGINKTVSLIGVSIIASVPQSGTCRAISIEADQAVVQARQCYIAGTYNQTTLVYFSGGVGQAARLRFCYLDGNNPTNDATRVFTYACQFHAEAASYGTPEVGDRAAYNHNHDAAYLKRSGGDFTTFPDIYNLHAGDNFLIEKASDASKAKVTADIIADYWFNYYYTTFLRSEGGAFTQFTQKTAPNSADRLLLEDSADYYNKKYSTLGSIKTSLEIGFNADLLDGQHGSYYTPELGGMSYANRLRSGYSSTDDFITAPTYNWAGSPFYTPDWYDTLYSRLRFRPPQNQRSMFVLPLSTQLMVYSGYNGNTVGDYWGIRFDDGTDNNYAELVFYIAQTNPFLWDIRLRWVIGGGAMNSTTIVQSINVPPTQIIHIYRDGSDWSSWMCRPTIRMPWGITSIVGIATSTLTWTPTRAGLLCKTSQTWPITEIDWYYRVN